MWIFTISFINCAYLKVEVSFFFNLSHYNCFSFKKLHAPFYPRWWNIILKGSKGHISFEGRDLCKSCYLWTHFLDLLFIPFHIQHTDHVTYRYILLCSVPPTIKRKTANFDLFLYFTLFLEQFPLQIYKNYFLNLPMIFSFRDLKVTTHAYFELNPYGTLYIKNEIFFLVFIHISTADINRVFTSLISNYITIFYCRYIRMRVTI